MPRYFRSAVDSDGLLVGFAFGSDVPSINHKIYSAGLLPHGDHVKVYRKDWEGKDE